MKHKLTFLLYSFFIPSLFLLYSFFASGSIAIAQNQIVPRDGEFTINLQEGDVDGTSNPILQWGDEDRGADHATLAMNDAGDILVAYHSNRNVLGLPSLLQVEIAYFEFLPGATRALDSWAMISQQLVGSIEYAPLSYNQNMVSCERPDVITDGERFFVTWTRRYDKDYQIPTQELGPAIMECAIVQRNGNDVDVFNDSSVVPNNPYGLGHELHADFATRDCLGVADSVVLNQPSGSDPTFGVIYPVQTDFSDLVLPADGTRKFDLYLVTCSINSSGLLSSSTPVVIQSGVVFDGPTLPSGGTAKGLILPDAAPSSAENAFWLTYEAQRVNPPNIIGGVRLEYYIFDPTNNAWNMDAAKNFVTSNPSSIYLNRRPHISSMPGVSTNEEVSLVFNFVPSPPVGSNANVFCEQWEYSGGGLQQLMSQAFPNDTSENDGKPTVLHGPATPLIRRCYFGREEGGPSGGGIWYYDVNTSSLVQESISNTADRPASDYGLVQGEHTLPLTWEDELFPIGAPVHKRIVLKPKWLQ